LTVQVTATPSAATTISAATSEVRRIISERV
jgi:hypothetical protein